MVKVFNVHLNYAIFFFLNSESCFNVANVFCDILQCFHSSVNNVIIQYGMPLCTEKYSVIFLK